jgi:hypothetical protein
VRPSPIGDLDTVYIVPIESDQFRCVPEGKMRVYRTRDSGGSWEPLSRGLPQDGAYETVLRDALCVDGHHPAGVYVGTKSGKVFGSADDGDSWNVIADGLPPIACQRRLAGGGPAPPLGPRRRGSSVLGSRFRCILDARRAQRPRRNHSHTAKVE